VTDRTFPTGTVTFLASDIEGSTRLVQEVGPAVFREILELHNEILRGAFARHGGTERGTQGDSFLVMFREAPAGLAAAADAQTALAAASWPQGAQVRVRMGLHTGVGMLGGDDYVGIDVHRAARIASAAHGAQVLLSEATRGLVESSLSPGTALRGLGEHKLRDLARPEQLYQLVIDGLPSNFPPIETTEVVAAGNLPVRLTGFIGREVELEELGRLFEESRLITLTGPGGTGKTSLAVAFASDNAAAFRHGAWFVRLEATADPSLVASAIAGSLGLVESPGLSSAERVAEYLKDRSVLMILDNFEQVLPAAGLVGDLLRAAPALKVIVTSRAALRLSAEQEFPVAPLALPGPIDPVAGALKSPAVQLFVERARRVRPGYALTSDDASAVAEICRRLDGLPLGIELAASRVALLPPRTIAERLAERLDLPGAAPRDLPARQRSMERAIAWSYDLLEPPEQRLLARLSVFRGGCRLEEADAICGPASELGVDVLEGLSVLVDHSLAQPVPGPDGARFRLLETIQRYSDDRLDELGEATAIGWRHALAYRDLAEAAAPHLPGGDQLRWLDRLTAEHDNLRAASRWAIERGDSELALRLGAALWRFWQLRGHLEEGLSQMTRILEMPGADAPTPWRMRAIEAAGGLHYWTADVSGADALYRSQLEVAQTLGDARGTADAMFNLGHTRFLLDRDHTAADQLADEAVLLYRQAGDEGAIARVAWTRANRLLEQGHPGVEQQILEALRHFEELGDEWYVALAQGTLGWAAFARGDVVGALRWGLAAIGGHHAMGDIASTTIVLRGIAIVFLDWGMPEEAATIHSAFEALCQRYGVRPPAYFEELGPDVRGRREIDLNGYPAAVERGASMSLEEAVDYVVTVARERLAQPR
jgi:predicted ATPase/class 3 adenylate cyclase